MEDPNNAGKPPQVVLSTHSNWKPIGHAQSVTAVLEIGELALAGHVVHALAPATAEYVPAPQSMHVEFPGVFLYFPVPHASHVPPFCPL